MAIRGVVGRRNAVADVNVVEENGMVTIAVRACNALVNFSIGFYEVSITYSPVNFLKPQKRGGLVE